jgi:hypothetical protein
VAAVSPSFALGATGLSLSAKALRTAVTALLIPDPTNPLGVRSGILAGPTGSNGELTVSGGAVTVRPFRAVIQGTHTADQGGYVFVNDADANLPHPAQHASQHRRSQIVARVYDSQAAGVPSSPATDRFTLEVIDGPLSATAPGPLPDLTGVANALPIGEVVIPPTGQPVTVTAYTAARGAGPRGAAMRAATFADLAALPKVDGWTAAVEATGRVMRYSGTLGRWEYASGPWYPWTPVFASAGGGNLTFGSGAQVAGRYAVVDGRLRYDVSIYCGTNPYGGIGTITMLLPASAVNASAPARGSGTVSLYVSGATGLFVGTCIAAAGTNVLELWFPKNYQDNTHDRFRNATGSAVAGSGVPLIAGTYPLVTGSHLRLTGEHELATWAAPAA